MLEAFIKGISLDGVSPNRPLSRETTFREPIANVLEINKPPGGLILNHGILYICLMSAVTSSSVNFC